MNWNPVPMKQQTLVENQCAWNLSWLYLPPISTNGSSFHHHGIFAGYNWPNALFLMWLQVNWNPEIFIMYAYLCEKKWNFRLNIHQRGHYQNETFGVVIKIKAGEILNCHE